MTYRLETYSDIGTLLRDVRESYNLDLKQVAHALNLREKYVEALEEGDIEALPGMAYARGYIRNYALLLGLDVDKLLSSFETVGVHPVSDRFLPRVDAKEILPSGWLVGAASGVVLLVFLLSGGFFSFSGPQDGVRAVPPELEAQYRHRQEQAAALPDCFQLLLASRAPLCYYRRDIRRTAWLPKWRFSTVLTPQSVSGPIEGIES